MSGALQLHSRLGDGTAHQDHRSHRYADLLRRPTQHLATRLGRNANGLLSQHFPKSTDLSFYGAGILDNVTARLNTPPLKCHGFRSPTHMGN
ncbi:hypothetical protein FH975_02285 [Nesterenkonia sp. Hz 6-5]|uniref:hypothetical protein n=1 Tax=Nesterenkonia haasae TaxID=2587813 RepID=UPI001390C5C3|nr:hypothetical protein [Nesterenkonia haasae]